MVVRVCGLLPLKKLKNVVVAENLVSSHELFSNTNSLRKKLDFRIRFSGTTSLSTLRRV